MQVENAEAMPAAPTCTTVAPMTPDASPTLVGAMMPIYIHYPYSSWTMMGGKLRRNSYTQSDMHFLKF